jgi:hypothetical protein
MRPSAVVTYPDNDRDCATVPVFACTLF